MLNVRPLNWLRLLKKLVKGRRGRRCSDLSGDHHRPPPGPSGRNAMQIKIGKWQQEKTADEWCAYFEIQMVRPTGWTDLGIPWNAPLTEAQFINLATSSYINAGSNMELFRKARELEENKGLFIS